jgi:thioredoxin 1
MRNRKSDRDKDAARARADIPGMNATDAAFHCTRCGREIFRKADLIDTVELWDLGEYRARAYAVRRLTDEPGLTRYDASLHEGWYCCRFIAMRMVVDKFGTGDQLLVYVDSVAEVAAGSPAPKSHEDKGQLALTAADFEAVISAPENRGKLLWIKLGAIWCPPCRLLDSVIARLVRERALPDVRFFEIDIDQERELASRFDTRSIPYSLLYLDGARLKLDGPRAGRDGGIVGGLSSAQVKAIAEEVTGDPRRFDRTSVQGAAR